MFFRKVWAFFKRDMTEAFSYKTSFFFEGIGMFANIFTFFFVAKVVGNASPLLQAYGSYFPFVLIGIAFAGFQSIALNSFASAVQKEQGAGTLEAILITPTRLGTVIFSGALWDLGFATLKVLAYLLIGGLFLGVDLSHINVVAALVILVLMVMSLAGLGLFSAGFALVLKRGDPVNYFFNGISRFLSGVYFPVSILPLWVQKFSLFIPLTYSLEAVRMALLEGKNIFALQQEIACLLLFSVLFLPSGLLFFGWAVKRSKKTGSLGFY
ncbi:MAG: hypothetical protein A3H42_06380 [Deltaproteobacteria bacterium RIFCSPLOWO2_02_FULL_46_8]|nr:MAG: hypothetical protein A3H42_06380 [Deltaproteobacteria bacterium RIFCSPLOWO2_02_FULL_46_8]